MAVWYREWEKEHAQLWEAITGRISPKVLTPAPKLIALFWRWIKAFVLWLSKLERSLPAGLDQHSISPQQCLPAWWTLLPRSRRAWQETGCLHTHICILVLWRNAPMCTDPCRNTPPRTRTGFCVHAHLHAQIICKMQKQIQACHFSNSRSNNRTPGMHEKVCVKWRRSWRALNEAVSGSPW